MNNPLISILMAVYNGERYLREALDSLLAQTYANWQLLCVDDGSTDSSRCILKEYSERDSRTGIALRTAPDTRTTGRKRGRHAPHHRLRE